MKRKNSFLAIFLSFALLFSLFLLSGCGAKSSAYLDAADSSMAISNGFSFDEAEVEEVEYATETAESAAGSGELDTTVLEASVERKLTYRANVDMETKTYRETITEIENLIASKNGYVASSSISDYGDDSDRAYARNAYFETQIPAESLDGFLEELKEIGNVLNVSKQVEDITTSYYNTQSRLEALQAEEERLIAMQESAETLDELLTIEGYLSDVRSDINYLHNMMQVYEKQVSYSTVEIYLSEVVDYTSVPVQNPTFGEQIAEAFQSSLDFFAELGQGIILMIVFIAPTLLTLAAIIVVVVFLVKRISKKRARRKAERDAQAQQPAQLEQSDENQNA